MTADTRASAVPTPADGVPRRRPRRRRRANRIVSWVCGILVAAFSGVLIATVALPLAMGWVPLTVITGSMDPTIPPGSQVIVKPLTPAQAQNLRTGQVITFQIESGGDEVVTHRIISVDEENGETVYRTQGDANAAADPDPVRAVQVRGLVRYHVPLVGYVATLTSPEQKRVGTWIAAGLFGAYAAWEIARPKRRGSGRH
ncbi:signal peptidase I [Brevibacterium casei]|uniref:Signal peptidase I n=1 Tax=Brevibacterium casei CIP 102111 TaxID=1255625 RepID=A0A2H1KIF7_9MICO|nr:signal peptidase I [Brevibacterium casei]MCT1767121.1 signal peptidase I [Brevibacterium casei]QPR38006.1 signal peptidase I [Brevibacterium casei]QPR45297.1 signal peptidase I [Brevibacterium casei]SMX99557.1 signal peptidase, endoplasmic reticulum-type [Brevibacterium casei CIP 102111]